MINRFGKPAPGVQANEPEMGDPSSAAAVAAERLGPVWNRVHAVVSENPKASLIAALAAGVMLGWIIKRR